MSQRDENGQFTEQLRRSFPMFTNGKMPHIDRLGVVVQCFEEMDKSEQRAALGYLNARFGDQPQKGRE